MAHPEQAAMQSAQATTASLAAATASLAECEDLAAQTGSELLEQRQTLQRTRDKTHELEYQNKKAAHTLRGMTFWGSIVNWWTGPPERSHIPEYGQGPASSIGKAPSTSDAGQGDSQRQRQAHAVQAPSEARFATASAPQLQHEEAKQAALLESISSKLDGLAEAGRGMQDELDGQTALVGETTEALEKATEEAKANAKTARRRGYGW